ncbi:ABC transporter ATP-binding protein [Leucobacter massiliensis]|uniref:Peptide ABC transporter ATP-binding protein n=1 Tax=Leucobacter massiliensis TaxID=1686285 RepID=A0A2S9QLC7_9MICO|nr:oligopeptide/dipeptide ABC transporter ATP-binding protein [Leucobacter massiliensis]PRI10389.1 peptide ABC transporter ATP-binding protein [Leucobacter massiliensis]
MTSLDVVRDPAPTAEPGAATEPRPPAEPGSLSELAGPGEVVLEVEDLVQRFSVPGGVVHAVDGVSFVLRRGETLALVGESGCGKSTLARSLMRLQRPRSGSVRLLGEELTAMPRRRLRRMLARMQMIFQDPISSLNPRRRTRDIIAEGLRIHGAERAGIPARVREVMGEVGLDPDTMSERRPGDFSGGQCQRIAIARAMALSPEVLICDEPVSALDVSVQAQVLNLLERMRREHGLGMLFISHDLSVVRNVSDRVAVMYLGKIVEIGDTDDVYAAPAHPYSRALIASVPAPGGAALAADAELRGELPSPMRPPSGCRFRTRCPLASDRCASEAPAFREIVPGRRVACHHPLIEALPAAQTAGAGS